MSDLTFELSYDDRSTLLTALNYARKSFQDGEEVRKMDDLAIRISRLECQPGGCQYCNADRAREEDDYANDF